MCPLTLALCRDPQRRQRLDASVVTMYHGTSAANAKSIGKTGFLRGPGGQAGPGIYLAATPAAACNLARHHGVCLEVQVKLGDILTITPPHRAITFTTLAVCNYDSVTFTEQGNDFTLETVYTVYNKDQVKVTRCVAWVGDLHPKRMPRLPRSLLS